MSFSVSKYWVMSTRFITSFAVVPGTDLWNSSTDSRKPAMIALR